MATEAGMGGLIARTRTGVAMRALVLGASLLSASAAGAVTGACCLPDGSCSVLIADDCAAQGGEYQGDNSDCANVDCPTLCGFSSFPECDGDCSEGQECVQSMFSEETGGGAQVSDQCECRVVEGACCWPSGVCTMQSEQTCVDGGATYQGDNSDCANVDCPTLCDLALAPQCMGSCDPEETCVPTAPGGSGALVGGGAQVVHGQCECVVTSVPLGGDCSATSQCSGEATCIDGTCTGEAAVAPATSNTGLLVALALLAGVGGFAILRRRGLPH